MRYAVFAFLIAITAVYVPGSIPFYRFWNPASGFPGGLLFGALIAAAIDTWLIIKAGHA